MSILKLIYQLGHLIQAKNATTFFLNGAPGSGKSYLLRELAEQLPAELSRSMVLGPYQIAGADVGKLGELILKDCQEAGFLDAPLPARGELDLASAWQWLRENAYVPRGQTFLVLIELEEATMLKLDLIGSLFSGASVNHVQPTASSSLKSKS